MLSRIAFVKKPDITTHTQTDMQEEEEEGGESISRYSHLGMRPACSNWTADISPLPVPPPPVAANRKGGGEGGSLQENKVKSAPTDKGGAQKMEARYRDMLFLRVSAPNCKPKSALAGRKILLRRSWQPELFGTQLDFIEGGRRWLGRQNTSLSAR